jgi:glutamate synthase (ferredoxin)
MTLNYRFVKVDIILNLLDLFYTASKLFSRLHFIKTFITGEYHGNNPEMSKLLHKAVRQKSENAFSIYQQHLSNRPVNVSAEIN